MFPSNGPPAREMSPRTRAGAGCVHQSGNDGSSPPAPSIAWRCQRPPARCMWAVGDIADWASRVAPSRQSAAWLSPRMGRQPRSRDGTDPPSLPCPPPRALRADGCHHPDLPRLHRCASGAAPRAPSCLPLVPTTNRGVAAQPLSPLEPTLFGAVPRRQWPSSCCGRASRR